MQSQWKQVQRDTLKVCYLRRKDDRARKGDQGVVVGEIVVVEVVVSVVALREIHPG